MRCRGCQHALWKVAARRCPACDLSFKPSDFRFRTGTVRFSCPHCSQGYLGGGPDGLPDPRRFECAFCGKTIDADEMVLETADGVEEHETAPDTIPWIEEHRSWPARWALTVWLAATNPRRLVQLTPRDLSIKSAVVFTATTQCALAAVIVALALVAGVVLSLPGGASAFGALSGRGLLWLLVTFVGTACFAAAWVAASHAATRRTRPGAGIAQAVHAVCFGCAPHALWYLPVVGPFVGWVGTLVWARSVVIALEESNGLKPRAVRIAGGAWPVACLVALAAVWGGSASGLIGWWRPGPASWVASEEESVSGFDGPLRAVIARDGLAAHAGELMLDGTVLPEQFLAPGSRATLAEVEIAGVTLEQFAQLAPARRLAVVRQAVGRLEAGVPSHRLGDYVFVLDALAERSPGLWVVIEAWDPRLNETGGPVHVLYADGAVRSIQSQAVPSALYAQNRARRKAGLPALSDPRSLYDNPAARGDG